MFSIDENVEALETILRHLAAGRFKEAQAATERSLQLAAMQQQKYWAHCAAREAERMGPSSETAPSWQVQQAG